jgi:hypothetical protein
MKLARGPSKVTVRCCSPTSSRRKSCRAALPRGRPPSNRFRRRSGRRSGSRCCRRSPRARRSHGQAPRRAHWRRRREAQAPEAVVRVDSQRPRVGAMREGTRRLAELAVGVNCAGVGVRRVIARGCSSWTLSNLPGGWPPGPHADCYQPALLVSFWVDEWAVALGPGDVTLRPPCRVFGRAALGAT